MVEVDENELIHEVNMAVEEAMDLFNENNPGADREEARRLIIDVGEALKDKNYTLALILARKAEAAARGGGEIAPSIPLIDTDAISLADVVSEPALPTPEPRPSPAPPIVVVTPTAAPPPPPLQPLMNAPGLPDLGELEADLKEFSIGSDPIISGEVNTPSKPAKPVKKPGSRINLGAVPWRDIAVVVVLVVVVVVVLFIPLPF